MIIFIFDCLLNLHSLEIHILQTTNEVLRERNDLESNFKNLTIKLSKLEKEEQERQDQVNKIKITSYE